MAFFHNPTLQHHPSRLSLPNWLTENYDGIIRRRLDRRDADADIRKRIQITEVRAAAADLRQRSHKCRIADEARAKLDVGRIVIDAIDLDPTGNSWISRNAKLTKVKTATGNKATSLADYEAPHFVLTQADDRNINRSSLSNAASSDDHTGNIVDD